MPIWSWPLTCHVSIIVVTDCYVSIIVVSVHRVNIVVIDHHVISIVVIDRHVSIIVVFDRHVSIIVVIMKRSRGGGSHGSGACCGGWRAEVSIQEACVKLIDLSFAVMKLN